MAASYPDGVKTWTPRTDGVDDVMAADINSIYEEVTALETYAIPNNGDASDVTVAFTQASTRANLTSGEKLKISLGKLMKWFADLKTVAFSGSYSDLTNKPTIPDGKKVARFVVGTSTAGWTAADCDYLCDGTADQVEINNAITALPATGGEIVILDGTYNITAKIDVNKNNISIRGNGNATILKRMFNSSAVEGVITLTGRSGCKIADLQVDGNKASYTNSNNHGIYLSNSSNNTITGNTCNNNRFGIHLRDSSSNNTVTGNTCNNNSSSGIYLVSSSNDNNITGNTCNNNDRGIYLYSSSSNNTVTGNTCIRGTGLSTDYTASQYTIQLAGTDNNYNLISNNNCMGKAVTVGGGTGNTLVNNKFDEA